MKEFIYFFCIFLVFPILRKPAAYLTVLCFQRIQGWKQWDCGGWGSLLKEQQFWLSWENEYADYWRHAVWGSTGIVRCLHQMDLLALEWCSGNERMSMDTARVLLCDTQQNEVLFDQMATTICIYAVYHKSKMEFVYCKMAIGFPICHFTDN